MVCNIDVRLVTITIMYVDLPHICLGYMHLGVYHRPHSGDELLSEGAFTYFPVNTYRAVATVLQSTNYNTSFQLFNNSYIIKFQIHLSVVYLEEQGLIQWLQ